MSKFAGFKKYTLLLCLLFIISLSCLGMGWGMWTDDLNADMTINMATFDPQVEVYKVNRCWGDANRWPTDFDDADVFPIERDNNRRIVVRVGGNSNNDIDENAVPGDKYRYYFTVTNNSDIPVHYRVRNLLVGGQAGAVTVNPSSWTLLPAGESTQVSDSNNYAQIYVSHNYFSTPNGFNKNFAIVEVRQFNGVGWDYEATLRIHINKFVTVRL